MNKRLVHHQMSIMFDDRLSPMQGESLYYTLEFETGILYRGRIFLNFTFDNSSDTLQSIKREFPIWVEVEGLIGNLS